MVCCLVGMFQSEVVVNKNWGGGGGGWSAYNTSSIYNFGSAYGVSCTYLEIKILQPAFVARWSPKPRGFSTGKSR